MFLAPALESGAAFRTSAFEGVALRIPAGAHFDEEALGAMVEQAIVPAAQAEVYAPLEQMRAHHPDEPHWYRPMIGVDPLFQGRGCGSALLRPALAACDAAGCPAHLESSRERNLPLYRRFGFEVVGTLQVGNSLTAWPMLRPPPAA